MKSFAVIYVCSTVVLPEMQYSIRFLFTIFLRNHCLLLKEPSNQRTCTQRLNLEELLAEFLCRDSLYKSVRHRSMLVQSSRLPYDNLQYIPQKGLLKNRYAQDEVLSSFYFPLEMANLSVPI